MEYFVFYLLGFVLNMFILHIINLREIDDVDINSAFLMSLSSWLVVLFFCVFLLDHYGFFDGIEKKFNSFFDGIDKKFNSFFDGVDKKFRGIK